MYANIPILGLFQDYYTYIGNIPIYGLYSNTHQNIYPLYSMIFYGVYYPILWDVNEKSKIL